MEIRERTPVSDQGLGPQTALARTLIFRQALSDDRPHLCEGLDLKVGLDVGLDGIHLGFEPAGELDGRQTRRLCRSNVAIEQVADQEGTFMAMGQALHALVEFGALLTFDDAG